jgi:hypothetical protein
LIPKEATYTEVKVIFLEIYSKFGVRQIGVKVSAEFRVSQNSGSYCVLFSKGKSITKLVIIQHFKQCGRTEMSISSSVSCFQAEISCTTKNIDYIQ